MHGVDGPVPAGVHDRHYQRFQRPSSPPPPPAAGGRTRPSTGCDGSPRQTTWKGAGAPPPPPPPRLVAVFAILPRRLHHHPPPTPDPTCDKDDISNLALVETPKCGSWCRYGKPRGSRIPTTARACAIGRPRHPRAVVSLIRGRESGRVRERCYYTT